jgi:hypothetical protein
MGEDELNTASTRFATYFFRCLNRFSQDMETLYLEATFYLPVLEPDDVYEVNDVMRMWTLFFEMNGAHCTRLSHRKIYLRFEELVEKDTFSLMISTWSQALVMALESGEKECILDTMQRRAPLNALVETLFKQYGFGTQMLDEERIMIYWID